MIEREKVADLFKVIFKFSAQSISKEVFSINTIIFEERKRQPLATLFFSLNLLMVT